MTLCDQHHDLFQNFPPKGGPTPISSTSQSSRPLAQGHRGSASLDRPVLDIPYKQSHAACGPVGRLLSLGTKVRHGQCVPTLPFQG